jgi:hypothetical protein
MYKTKKSKRQRPTKYLVSTSSLKFAWDEGSKSYDPQKLFAFWRRSKVLELWQAEGVSLQDFSLKLALNYPTHILTDFRLWYTAQTDNEHLVRCDWTSFDNWLKLNGYTGKVDKETFYKKYVPLTEEDKEAWSNRKITNGPMETTTSPRKE